MAKKDRITNDEVTAYIRGYCKGQNDFLESLRAYGEENNIPIILPETENYLNTLLSITKPKKILEIGTAIGYSAIYFAEKTKVAQIYSVERDEEMYCKAVENVEKANLESRIFLNYGDGIEYLDKLIEEGHRDFDLVFIDAAKSYYREFLERSMLLTKKNGLILSDNILQHGMTVYYDLDKYRKHRTNVIKMREYINYICSCPSLETSILAIGDGIALSINKGDYEK